MRYILILFVLASFIIYPEIFSGYIDLGAILCCVLIAAFQIIASIWLYKDFVGWNKFEYSEGLRLKRKKETK